MRKLAILFILALAVAPYVWAASTRTLTADAFVSTTGGRTFTLPTTTGTTGQYLQTNGSGTTSWQTVSSGGTAAATQLGVNNLGISTSVASSALTINLTQLDGATNPSSGANAVSIPFPNAPTTTTGSTATTRTVTSALSITLPSGATLGLSAAPNYIWVYAEYDSSNAAVQLCVSGTAYPDGSFFQNLLSTNYYTFISSGSTSEFPYYCAGSPGSDGVVRLIGRIYTTLPGAWTFNPIQTITMPTPVRAVSPWKCGPLNWQGTTTAPTPSTTKTLSSSCYRREGRYSINEYNYTQTANTGAVAGSGDYYLQFLQDSGSGIDMNYTGFFNSGTPLGTVAPYTTTPGVITGAGMANARLESSGYISQGATANGPCFAYNFGSGNIKVVCDNAFTSRTVLSATNATYNLAITGQLSFRLTVKAPIVGWTEYGPLY